MVAGEGLGYTGGRWLIVGIENVECIFSEPGFYTPPALEGKIATDTLTSLPAPVVYNISGPWEKDFL